MEDSGGQKSAIPVINFPLTLKMPLPLLSQQSLVFRFSYHMTDTRNPGNMGVFLIACQITTMIHFSQIYKPTRERHSKR